MTHFRFVRSARAWLCLSAAALLAAGCTPGGGTWNGIFAADVAGKARTCSAPAAAPADGQAVVAQIAMSGDGWCGITATRNGAAYDSYLLTGRPTHGTVFAHHVGATTRIDYRLDAGFTGGDRFSVRLIPGGAVIEGTVSVTP